MANTGSNWVTYYLRSHNTLFNMINTPQDLDKAKPIKGITFFCNSRGRGF